MYYQQLLKIFDKKELEMVYDMLTNQKCGFSERLKDYMIIE